MIAGNELPTRLHRDRRRATADVSFETTGPLGIGAALFRGDRLRLHPVHQSRLDRIILPRGFLRLPLPDERFVSPPLAIGFFLAPPLPLGLFPALTFELPLFRFDGSQRVLDGGDRRIERAERRERASVIPALCALQSILDRDLRPALDLLLPPPLLDRRFRARLQIECFLLLGLLRQRFGGCLRRGVEFSVLEALPGPVQCDGDRMRALARAALFVAARRDLLVERLHVARIRAHLERLRDQVLGSREGAP
jgi:hypothetical protein